MAIISSGRQEVISARYKISLGTGNDIAAQGTYPSLSLPEGAVVVGGFIYVSDASTASSTIDLGSLSGAVSLATVAKTDLTITGIEEPAAIVIDAVIAGADPVAAGVVEITVNYVVDDRAAFSQG